MSKDFGNQDSGIESPAEDAFAITPTDGVDLANLTRALYVGSTGNLAVVMRSGASVVFTDVQAGTILPVRVSRVDLTGTTAGGIVGLR